MLKPPVPTSSTGCHRSSASTSEAFLMERQYDEAITVYKKGGKQEPNIRRSARLFSLRVAGKTHAPAGH